MSSSLRGPQGPWQPTGREPDRATSPSNSAGFAGRSCDRAKRQAQPTGPYVLHLERVVQLIDRGNTLTVELHPCSDLPNVTGGLIRRIGAHILDGGEVMLIALNGMSTLQLGLTLANYKQIWRCWVGNPTERQRRELRWQTR